MMPSTRCARGPDSRPVDAHRRRLESNSMESTACRPCPTTSGEARKRSSAACIQASQPRVSSPRCHSPCGSHCAHRRRVAALFASQAGPTRAAPLSTCPARGYIWVSAIRMRSFRSSCRRCCSRVARRAVGAPLHSTRSRDGSVHRHPPAAGLFSLGFCPLASRSRIDPAAAERCAASAAPRWRLGHRRASSSQSWGSVHRPRAGKSDQAASERCAAPPSGSRWAWRGAQLRSSYLARRRVR